MLELDILIVGSSMSFSLSPEQLQPALDFIRAGDASGLDRWLSSHEGLDQTLVVSAGKGEGWVLSKLVTAVALNPAPAHRTALLEVMDPVMSARRPGWVSSWLSFMPEALTGPRDVVEYFLGKGVRWDSKYPSDGPVWGMIPTHAHERSVDYLTWAHAASGPWPTEEMDAAARRALVAPDAKALRRLIDLGADLSRPLVLPNGEALSLVLYLATQRGFEPFVEVLGVLMEQGLCSPDHPSFGAALENNRGLSCAITDRPVLALLEEFQARHLGHALARSLPLKLVSRRPIRF